MALSGNLSTTYKGYTYRVEWSAKQSVAGNYSDLTLTHKLVCGSTWDLYIASRTGSATVGGVKDDYTAPKISTGGGTTITLGTTTHRVTHNADGSKTDVAVSAVFNLGATIQGTYKASISVSGKINLDTIPRASQPSCVTWPEHTQNVGEFGDTISIHMNRKSDAFTHIVYYSYGPRSWVKIADNVTTGTTWKIPEDLMDLIPNDTKGSGTIHVETYNGSTYVGAKTCGFTATVPASVKPTCSVQVLDATDTKDTYGSLVMGLSKLQVKTTGKPARSSPIASYNVTANGTKYTAADITTDVLKTSDTTTVTATVTDKRGRTSAAASASFPVLAYTKPTISALSVHRCAADGTEDDQGEYIRVTFSAAITPLNNKNSAAYSLRYKKSTDDSFTPVDFSGLSGKYAVTDHSYIFAADSDYSYDIEVVAEDDKHTVARATSASTGFTFMDWNDDGKSIAFGKVSEEEETMENALALRQMGNRYAFSTPGVASQAGIICMARISITAANADTPITFVLSRRQSESPMTVHVQLSNVTATTSSVKSIRYEGSNYGAFLTPGGDELTWDLYVNKGSAWDTVTIQDWYTSKTMMSRINVTFPGNIVDAVPTPFWRAGPLIAESILDCFFPVGFVLILYSHADPNDMYPGTTWVRIENSFLWGCDADGDIGTTGGEKTHTLTVAELPAHSHGAVYSAQAPGNKQYGWYQTSGSNMAHGLVETGGGQAHNNMPPYVQVSIWRRTA